MPVNAAAAVICIVAVSASVTFSAVRLSVAEESAAPSEIDFVRDVQPILRKHCYRCHGSKLQRAGLRLDAKRQALRGSDNGRVIVPGNPAQSRLVKLVSTGDAGRFMPPRNEAPPLAPEQVAVLRHWIKQGADWPDGVDPVSPQRRQHWSFAPIRRPEIPTVRGANWVRNPIDAFILAKLEAANIEPAPPAAPRALARRASFDLLGLPPNPLEADKLAHSMARRPQGPVFKRFIERLLASPHYGERWGRHWLDLARYADSNGYEVDGTKPMAWKYRDYVIRALNADTPYDRFIMEQLAGDELPDATSETVIATGFLRMGPWDAERGASVQPGEVAAERSNELDDIVSTTSQVFLGITLGCARCHNHKFDPLTSRDYYSMVSIFNPLQRHRDGRTELTRPAVPPRELPEKNQADARIAALEERIQSLIEPLRLGLLESEETNLPADAVAALKSPPDKRTDDQKKLAKRFASRFDKRVTGAIEQKSVAARYLSAAAIREIKDARQEIADLQSRFTYPQGYFLFEPSPNPPVTHLLIRGNPNQPGPVVEPAVPAAIVQQAGQQPPDFESPNEFTSRRRLSLARWIADPDNPLTARVLVNRVWQYHFGLGLVRTPSDFGARGMPPTHPELLDWLAHWFVHDADWSLKKLHRLIMTSNTYRMSKLPNEAYAQLDPDNRLFWRFPYRRLEVEAIRDAMLAVSGQLNPSLYGPSMYPYIPPDARRSGYDPNAVWQTFDEGDASRRTIYAYVKRTLVVPFLETLDFCDTTRTTDRRDITTVAPQALELLNGEFVNRQAEHFAARLMRETGPDVDRRIARAYRLAFARPATEKERNALRQYWTRERAAVLEEEGVSADEAERRALVHVCRVIFNLNEFVYTD